MSGPEQFNAAAVGAAGLLDEYAASYGVNFPSTDILEKSCFKIVVPSWRRLNHASTSTDDFEVNVSEYAPKLSFVTRVQLVDVDIPNTQLLIEDIWNRVYFNLGCAVTPSCRTFNFNYHDVCANATCVSSVVLPLQCDAVRQWELLPTGYVRLYLQHRAPRPIVPLAHAWQSLQKLGYGTLALAGVPGLGTYALQYNTVSDDSNMSLIIYDAALWTALSTATPALPLFLTASVLPGPSFLATVIGRAVTYELNQQQPGDGACVPPQPWAFSLTYAEGGDTFDLQVRAPYPARMSVDGPLADYMGFGSPFVLGPADGVKNVTTGPRARFQMGDSFAVIQSGDPKNDAILAGWVADGFAAFVWAPFSFGVQFPGSSAVTVHIPGGYMSLAQVAAAVQTVLSAATLAASIACTLTPQGLAFASSLAFALDWTVDLTFAPDRVGYDVAVYAAVPVHTPVRQARHVPQLPGTCGASCCAPLLYQVPQCLVNVSFRERINQIVFETAPYAPFEGSVAAGGINQYVITAVPHLYANLQPGAQVSIAFVSGGTYYQVRALVTGPGAVDFSWTVSLVNPNDAVTLGTVTVIPQTVLPLVLFMQRSNTDPATLAACQGHAFPARYGRTVDPEILGFDAVTYESCGKVLASPGTLEKWQDSYILLCLAFAAGGAPPVTGDVYYPFPKRNTIVFAKVLRGSVFLRADFDRVFDHVFAGAGQHLGYIRVRILNPNGTPYQTHGHSVSITLKFDARSSTVAFGGGHVVIPGDSAVTMTPVARGGTMIFRDYGLEG